ALHAMGPGLADDILQGNARGDEFRTAPLWGLGKRLFFLHDRRPSDLLEAIRAPPRRGDEFRTTPLGGLGTRIFFLHDGRTSDLLEAIRAHRSAGNSKFGPSEA